MGFGLMAVFAKLAYSDGVELDALLVVRFGLAALLLGIICRARGLFRGIGWRAMLAGLLMGGIGYAAQAVLYLSALTHSDASLVALLFCLYPLMVMVAAIALRTDRPSARRGAALAVALAGVALVLGGAGAGRIDPLGSLLALGSAAVYTAYILVGDRLSTINHLAFAALVCTGAFVTFALSSLVRGIPDFAFETRGWLWLGLIAVVSTVASIVLFFAGLSEVGPTVASLLSIVEPVVTVTSAAIVFGETLSAVQMLGGALVLFTVLVAQLPPRRRACGSGPGAEELQDDRVIGVPVAG